MTVSHNKQPKCKQLILTLSSILFTTFPVITLVPSAEAASQSTTNVMTSGSMPTSTTPSSVTSTTGGVISTPTPPTTSPTPAPAPAPAPVAAPPTTLTTPPQTQTPVTTSTPTPQTITTINNPPAVTTTPPEPTTVQPGNKTPLNQPNMPDNSVLSWATDAAKSAYSYDFKNYNKQIQMNQPNFTNSGWNAFKSALDKSNNLKVVESKKLVASATPSGKAVILKKGVQNGIYTWEIEIPLLATYENESRLIKQNLQVKILVSRTNSPTGVGISHFVATVLPSTQPPITSTTTASPTTVTTGGSATTTGTTSTTVTGAPSTSTTTPPSSSIYPTTPTTTTGTTGSTVGTPATTTGTGTVTTPPPMNTGVGGTTTTTPSAPIAPATTSAPGSAGR